MRQSASMAEIATEDGTREEEEPVASQEESKETEGKEKGDGPPVGSDEQQLGQLEAGDKASAAPAEAESDSDTEDEEEEVQAVSVSPSAPLGQPACQTPPPATPSVPSHDSPSSFCSTSSSPSPSPTAGPSAISGITVTESPVPPGTPPSPGRCISVSSPGRGHKIFMVTRVESAAAAPNRSSDKHADTNAARQGSPSPQTQLTQSDLKGASSPPTDCKTADCSSPAQSRTLMPQPAEPTSTLAPEEAEPNQPKPALTSQPTEEEESHRGGDDESSIPTSVSTGAAEKQLTASSPPRESQAHEEEKNPPEGSETDEGRVGEQEAHLDATEKREAKAADESNTPAGGDSNGPEPASDEATCPAKVPEEGAVAAVLPNGLNSEFSLHLLDGDAPKAASCVMEHGEWRPSPLEGGKNC